MARPVYPEPKFFMTQEEYSKGSAWYLQNYFRHCREGNKLLGEKSTSYIECPAAARRMSESFPGAKIIAILRDPVRRAVSNYRYNVANGLETRDVEAALFADGAGPTEYNGVEVSVNPFSYLARGRYVEFLRAYARVFTVERVKVVTYEEFVGNMNSYLDLLGFLQVSPAEHRVRHRVNQGQGPRVALPVDVEQRLRRYFRDSNEALTTEFGVDVSYWI